MTECDADRQGRLFAPPPGAPAEESDAFVRVARVVDIPDDGGLAVKVGDREVGLFRVGGNIHAIDDRCPHQYAPLSEGTLCGATISCGLHAWRFDVTTGQPPGGVMAFPRVDSFEVRLADGWVYVSTLPRKRPSAPR